MIEHIDVQFSLLATGQKGEVAATQKARDRVIRVRAEQKIELRVQRCFRKSRTVTCFDFS